MREEIKSPIIGLYILDNSGIPLMARNYHELMSEIEAILLGGFFSAIEIFCRSNLKSNLTDIGIEGQRFYFETSNERYIHVVWCEIEPNNISDADQLDLIRLIQKRLKLLVNTINDFAEENMLYPDEMIKSSGASLDSIVFEAIFENIDDDEDRELKEGKTIDYNNITNNELLNKIKNLIN